MKYNKSWCSQCQQVHFKILKSASKNPVYPTNSLRIQVSDWTLVLVRLAPRSCWVQPLSSLLWHKHSWERRESKWERAQDRLWVVPETHGLVRSTGPKLPGPSPRWLKGGEWAQLRRLLSKHQAMRQQEHGLRLPTKNEAVATAAPRLAGGCGKCCFPPQLSRGALVCPSLQTSQQTIKSRS